MIPRTAPRLCLASIAAAVLALGAAGCCRNIPDEMFDNMFSAEIDGATLTEVREGNDDDDARCKAACMEIDASIAGSPESIVACSAEGIGEYIDAPWDPANDKVLLSCTGHYVEPGFCTGRRPLGHREAALAVDGRGAWLALHAHLEGASVIAFDELAAWLAARGAPAALRERCRAAADDEVRHAALLGALARREGAEVPPLAADPHDDDLVAVALHNAVEGCVAEAFAALIAARQAERADDPELRAAFASV
ncbi:MAG: ferritin-like domain-containing protein, partial [Nannocystaceae bacterium]